MSGQYGVHAEYQDSRLDWLGRIPKSWELRRLGGYFQERREKVSDADFSALSVTMQGIVPQLETAAKTDDGGNRKLVRVGDFVINSRSDRKGSSGVSPYDGSVSLISIVLKPINLHPPFVHHLLRSTAFQEEFYRFGKGIVADLWSTNYAAMKNIVIPVMPLEEQTQIAKFLDYETAKIDALIEKQQQLIALLKEKRQAVISHAVTKGLNPDAPMRDSGVEWLGEVPAHWEVVQLRRILESIEQGSSPLASANPPEEGGQGVLKISAIKTGVFNESQAKSLDDAPFEEAYRVRQGDLLVTRGNTPDLVADACVVAEEPKADLMMSDLIYRLNVSDLAHPRFLCLWLLSSCGRLQIKNDARGSSMTMAKVAQGHIKAWLVTLPSRDEQERIVGHIEYLEERTSTLLAKCESMMQGLQERRTALISAAVTGKIDVRNWQAPKAQTDTEAA